MTRRRTSTVCGVLSQAWHAEAWGCISHVGKHARHVYCQAFRTVPRCQRFPRVFLTKLGFHPGHSFDPPFLNTPFQESPSSHVAGFPKSGELWRREEQQRPLGEQDEEKRSSSRVSTGYLLLASKVRIPHD